MSSVDLKNCNENHCHWRQSQNVCGGLIPKSKTTKILAWPWRVELPPIVPPVTVTAAAEFSVQSSFIVFFFWRSLFISIRTFLKLFLFWFGYICSQRLVHTGVHQIFSKWQYAVRNTVYVLAQFITSFWVLEHINLIIFLLFSASFFSFPSPFLFVSLSLTSYTHCVSLVIAAWISSVVLPHPEHRDHVPSFLPSLPLRTFSSFLLHSSFLTFPFSLLCSFSPCSLPLSFSSFPFVCRHSDCIHMAGSGERWVCVRAFYYSDPGYVTVTKTFPDGKWKKKPQLKKRKKSSWNEKKVKDSDFGFRDSDISENIWKLPFLLIGSPSAHILSEFMNMLSYGALQIIFIKNCLISEDAICEWERVRIRRKQVFLSRMRMTEFLLEAEKKMCL